jgi:hypothetical protein
VLQETGTSITAFSHTQSSQNTLPNRYSSPQVKRQAPIILHSSLDHKVVSTFTFTSLLRLLVLLDALVSSGHTRNVSAKLHKVVNLDSSAWF